MLSFLFRHNVSQQWRVHPLFLWDKGGLITHGCCSKTQAGAGNEAAPTEEWKLLYRSCRDPLGPRIAYSPLCLPATPLFLHLKGEDLIFFKTPPSCSWQIGNGCQVWRLPLGAMLKRSAKTRVDNTGKSLWKIVIIIAKWLFLSGLWNVTPF